MVFHFHHLGNFILVYVFNSTCTPYLVCYRLTHPVIPVNTFTHVLSFLFSWGQQHVYSNVFIVCSRWFSCPCWPVLSWCGLFSRRPPSSLPPPPPLPPLLSSLVDPVTTLWTACPWMTRSDGIRCFTLMVPLCCKDTRGRPSPRNRPRRRRAKWFGGHFQSASRRMGTNFGIGSP